MTDAPLPPHFAPWRERLYRVIFEASTPGGKAFDVALIIAILASVVVVALETVPSIGARYAPAFRAAEWLLTAGFTVEYILRLISAPSAARYARSFFGVVDLVAILPTYVSLLVPGAQALLVVRGLRLLRVFRVLKLGHFLYEADVLVAALRASARKIAVFLFTVLTLVTIIGAMMYLIEGRKTGFTSIPMSMYWAIVTLTTVGYGDLAPVTVAGRTLASVVMILGYGIIAVPTGIVTVELAQAVRHPAGPACPQCGASGHDADARHCKHCGTLLGSDALRGGTPPHRPA